MTSGPFGRFNEYQRGRARTIATWTGGDGTMRRTTARVGVLSSIMLGTLALGSGDIGSASTASPAARGEIHAPRIPDPAPKPQKAVFARQWSSKNWSGYALSGTGITSVSGSWHVPQVQAPTTKRQSRTSRYSSSWVGIDGFNNRSLIQAGTEQDWLHGSAFYQAWWEILPAPETPIPSLTIQPGDAISVSITQGVSHQWTITVTDTTTLQSFTTAQTYTGPGASAEWIQEAPTINRWVASLASDSNVVFDLGTVSAANPALTASESGAMTKGPRQISTPSAPDPDGDGFAVAYGSVAPPPPSS
jgi:hypothetical protein